MRVLILSDIATSGGGNPYTLQLLHSLEGCADIAAVQHGTSWMRVPDIEFDLVHIQWPEELVGWTEPSDDELNLVYQALERWATKSTIVCTVHNEYPHDKDTEKFKSLYRYVYEKSDGIIHMGERSKDIIRRRYKDEVKYTRECVIPHGNYEWFPNKLSKKEARGNLGIKEHSKVFLCFGEIRNRKEIDFLLRGFSELSIANKELLIVGRMPYGKSRAQLGYYKVRLPLWVKKNVRIEEGFVDYKNVQYYLNSSDVVVVPRLDSINSGNVPLGFSFGRVVVGPDIGVIGEELRSTGNPVFDTQNLSSISHAMEEGLMMSKTSKPDENYKYAMDRLSWKKISTSHVKFYNKAIRYSFNDD